MSLCRLLARMTSPRFPALMRSVYLNTVRKGVIIGFPSYVERDAELKVCGSGSLRIGRSSRIDRRTLLYSESTLEIGENVYINRDCVIAAMFGIRIGHHVRIGERVTIRDHDHAYSDRSLPISQQGYRGADVCIDEGAWIGCNAVILKGVHIGRNSVVGASSVVTHDVADYAVVGGNPAKPLRTAALDNMNGLR